jgi:hypothetical protein
MVPIDTVDNCCRTGELGHVRSVSGSQTVLSLEQHSAFTGPDSTLLFAVSQLAHRSRNLSKITVVEGLAVPLDPVRERLLVGRESILTEHGS